MTLSFWDLLSNRMAGTDTLFCAVVKTEVISSPYQNLLNRLVLWSLNHDSADLSCSSTDSAPARTVLLERMWLYKPIICWSDVLQGDLTGNRANFFYTLIWSKTLFQSTCGISLQPFFPPPTHSCLYLQKRSPCTLTFMGMGGFVGKHLAQCLLWLSTSDLEGWRSSCCSAVSLGSSAFFFPLQNLFFPSVYPRSSLG